MSLHFTDRLIDDIEDFELDEFNDCDITDKDDIVFTANEPMKEGKDKRLSAVLSSTDMAHGSMHGDLDIQGVEGEVKII